MCMFSARQRVEGVEHLVEREAGVGGGVLEPACQSPSKKILMCETLETSVETSKDSPDRFLQAPKAPFPIGMWWGSYQTFVFRSYFVCLTHQWKCLLMRLRHRSGTDHTASSYLKCLRFLLPNKLIANTLVSSCADCLSREGFAFQTGSHDHSVGAGHAG